MNVMIDSALIIAAGRGQRFGGPCPKPLIEIAGAALIARTILSAREAGVKRFTVVTGYRRGVLESYLTREFPEIRRLHNDRWDRPNGLSVLRAKKEIAAPFALLMADHLFDPSILERLMEAPLPPGRCRLGVDFHPERVPDLEDATKVDVRDGLIRNIGKSLPDYNGVDTGIFLCSEAIFPALEQAITAGRESLSDGIQVLADAGRMEATDIGNLFWRDIDDEKALKEAEEKLKTVSSFKFQVSSSKQNL